MSHDSYICGFIKVTSNIDSAQEAINKLPSTSEKDEWPFLTSSMFSYTKSPEYRDRIIHFSASYKDILSSWKEWEVKFESLLHKFSYDQVKIIIEDCYQGDFIAIWSSVFDKDGKQKISKQIKALNYQDEPNIINFG